jgi:hypothetical protein
MTKNNGQFSKPSCAGDSPDAALKTEIEKKGFKRAEAAIY